jgi:long-chain acyl-CoA synthetase
MNVAQLLVRAARVFPDRPAVLLGSETVLNYGQLAARAARLAGYLRHEIGLAPGDRVAIYMANHVAYLEVLYAAWWAGLAVVPINAKLHPKEVEFIVADAKAGVLFVTEDHVPELRHVAQGPYAGRW